MPKQQIQLTATVQAPREAVFDFLNDHEQFGRIWAGQTRRVKDSSEMNNLNGVGSQREIKLGPIPGLLIFREEIITCQRPELLEYSVVGRGPIKNHLGRIALFTEGKATRIDYRIEFDATVPFTGGAIAADITKQWNSNFPKLAAELEQQNS